MVLICFYGHCISNKGIWKHVEPVILPSMKQLRLYRTILREEGWAALSKKAGRPVAIGLFMFFLLKGIAWLVLAYGGFELLF